MSRLSRNKGKRGERELAGELVRLFGCHARRGVQFAGGPDSPDVVTDIHGVHFECKRAERLSLYPALNQAIGDAGDKIPIVAHRSNRNPWVVIVRLDDLPKLVSSLEFQVTRNSSLETRNLELGTTANANID